MNSNPVPLKVTVPVEVVRSLLAAHAAAAGVEPCAALVGRVEGASVHVTEARVLENAHPAAHQAFALDPTALLSVARDARDKGLQVVGAWHGHPRGPAWPSWADEEGLLTAAVAPGGQQIPAPAGWVLLVSGRGAGTATVLRGFTPRPGGGKPREIQVVATGAKNPAPQTS